MRRRLIWLAVIGVLGAAASVFAAYRVSLMPPSLHPRAVVFATAKAELLVDTPASQLATIANGWGNLGPPQAATTYALLLYTDAARLAAADAAGIPGREISVSGPFTYDPSSSPTGFRAYSIPSLVPADNNYQLVVDIADLEPMLTLYAQAPTTHAAFAIVARMRTWLLQQVRDQEARVHVAEALRAVIRPLGPTTGGVVDNTGRMQVMEAAFSAVVVAGVGLMLAVERRRRRRATSVAPLDILEKGSAEDDWPHTSRPLPWSVAFFLVTLLLVPIDAVSLPAHLPLVANPDRVVLVAIALLWLLTLVVVRGAARPRVKLTHVHVAALAFLGLCCIGVGLNAHDLANHQEVVPVLKKLLLLTSFIFFFVIAASVMRPGEVPSFIGLIVILGVIVGIGAIVERQARYNVFYSVWRGVLPLQLPVGIDQPDTIGRLTVVGPTAQPLELAALMAMVLPFAIVGALGAATRRRRALYLVAAAILIAGGISSSRKTSLVAPLAGILVLVAYRPRPMLRGIAVASLPLLATVHILAPGQLGSLQQQLSPSNLTSVGTTTHRTARYEAIRPDVMTHLLFGRGYGSYDPFKYRVLDNQYLGLLIGVGVIGLLVYLAIFGGCVAAAHPMIRGPDRRRADAALGAATAIVVVLISSFLFDAISFTHVSYFSLFIGAMILALRGSQPRTAPRRAALRTSAPGAAATSTAAPAMSP